MFAGGRLGMLKRPENNVPIFFRKNGGVCLFGVCAVKWRNTVILI